MVYLYIRVSTKMQDRDKQKYELFNYLHDKHIKEYEIVEETVSSRKHYTERELGKLISKTKAGDIIISTELSRFGRSLMEIMEILNKLMEKNVKVYITKNNMELGENIQSKVLAFAFSLSAEIEKELISSRTKEALAKVKSEGKRLGRPKGALSKSKLDGREQEIDFYLSKIISIKSICKLMDVAPTTFYSFCKFRKIDLNRYKVK